MPQLSEIKTLNFGNKKPPPHRNGGKGVNFSLRPDYTVATVRQADPV